MQWGGGLSGVEERWACDSQPHHSKDINNSTSQMPLHAFRDKGSIGLFPHTHMVMDSMVTEVLSVI